jgi:hypothetical protein
VYDTVAERGELKWHAAYAVELARRATNRIFAGAGAHAIYDDSVLQTRYRDVNTAYIGRSQTSTATLRRPARPGSDLIPALPWDEPTR